MLRVVVGDKFMSKWKTTKELLMTDTLSNKNFHGARRNNTRIISSVR